MRNGQVREMCLDIQYDTSQTTPIMLNIPPILRTVSCNYGHVCRWHSVPPPILTSNSISIFPTFPFLYSESVFSHTWSLFPSIIEIMLIYEIIQDSTRQL